MGKNVICHLAITKIRKIRQMSKNVICKMSEEQRKRALSDKEDEGCKKKARVNAGGVDDAAGSQEINSDSTVPLIPEDVEFPTFAVFETATTTTLGENMMQQEPARRTTYAQSRDPVYIRAERRGLLGFRNEEERNKQAPVTDEHWQEIVESMSHPNTDSE